MHKICAKTVQMWFKVIGKTCDYLPTAYSSIVCMPQQEWLKLTCLSLFIDHTSTFLSTTNFTYLPLLKLQLCTVSTAPIIKTTK